MINIDYNMIKLLGLLVFALLILRIYFLFVSGGKVEEDPETEVDDVVKRAQRLFSDNMHNELQRYLRRELMTKYKSVELRRILADSYYKIGNYNSAAKHYEAILHLSPQDYEVRVLLAHSLKLDRQTNKAIKAYEEVLAKNPGESRVFKDVAELYMAASLHQKALEYFEKSVQNETDPEETLKLNIKIAKLNYDLGNLEQAVHVYDILQESSPDSVELMLKRANIYLSLHNWQRCHDIYIEIEKHKPDDLTVLEKIGQMKFNLELWDEALEIYNDLVQSEDTQSQNYIHHKNRIAEIYINMGKSELAIEILSDLITLYPTEDLLAFTLAQAYISLGDFANAVELYTNLMENLPEDQVAVIKKHISDIVCTWGGELIGGGDYNSAFDKLMLALKYDDTNPDIYYRLGSVNFHTKNYNDSIAHFQRAISLTPQVSEYYIALGHSYDELGDAKAARDAFQDAISINPDSPKAYNALAMSLAKGQNYKTAIQNFEIVLEHAPNDADASYNCALCYELSGDKENAVYYYEKALKLAPEHIEAQHNLDLLTGSSV